MTLLNVDPRRTRVLLIGNDDFPADPEDLEPLPAVANNLADLGEALRDEALFGVPAGQMRMLLNASAAAILIAVVDEARRAEDALIIYYAGHGLVHKGQLYLAAADSRAAVIAFTGVDLKRFREAISESPASKRILILDCCYSGRALGEMGGTSAAVTAAISDFAGSYVMASAPATAAASAPPGERNTLFTGALLHALREGVEGEGPTLRLPVLFHEVRRRLGTRPGAPEPQQMVTKNLNEAAVFHNLSPAAAKPEPNLATIVERLAAIESQNAQLRQLLETERAIEASAPEVRRLERQLRAGEASLQAERTEARRASTAQGAHDADRSENAPPARHDRAHALGRLSSTLLQSFWLNILNLFFPVAINVICITRAGNIGNNMSPIDSLTQPIRVLTWFWRYNLEDYQFLILLTFIASLLIYISCTCLMQWSFLRTTVMIIITNAFNIILLIKLIFVAE